MDGEEMLPLQNIGTGRSIQATTVNRERLPDDSNERMERICLKIPGKRPDRVRIVKMIVKRINNLTISDEEERMPFADIWISKWKTLKAAGIPVVPTIRRVSDTEVAMTDLSADGSGVYGKADITEERIRRNTDRKLMEIDLNKVIEKTQEIATRANQSGILLAMDDALVLVVHPDGNWEVMALDIGHTERREDFLKTVHPSHAENWNEEAVSFLIGYLNAIKDKILKSEGVTTYT